MKTIIGAIVFATIVAVASASAQKEYCFQNDGLKIRQIVSFTVTNSKIEGTLESGGYEEGYSMETFDFTGVKTGNTLNIKFLGNPPYERAPGTKKIVWTLSPESLKIPTYGKNNVTRKYSTYPAIFTKCKQD